MILYSLLRDRCGLSVDEAAALHGVSTSTIKSWSCGRRTPPPRAIAELRELYQKMSQEAERQIRIIERSKSLMCELDSTKEVIPYVGAHRAMLGMIAASINCPITIKEKP